MPTIEFKCQKLWLPEGTEDQLVSAQSRTTLCMARWLCPIAHEVINHVDDRYGEKQIPLSAVWANFESISDFAINATEVLAIVRPPEIDGSFRDREARRLTLAARMKMLLAIKLQENSDHLIMPKWEIEVMPEESSGYGMDRDGEEAYRW